MKRAVARIRARPKGAKGGRYQDKLVRIESRENLLERLEVLVGLRVAPSQGKLVDLIYLVGEMRMVMVHDLKERLP